MSWRTTISDGAWLYTNVDQSKVIQVVDTKSAALSSTNVSLSQFETIGSYNWTRDSGPDSPVIVVPGSPSVLGTLPHNKQLRKQQHEQFVDENRYQQPDYPLESLFRAVRLCSPEFSFSKDTDVVTDRNNLRKLIDFANGKVKQAFRIDMQKVGNLVLLIRKEEKSKMECDDYGKDFEDKCCVKASSDAGGGGDGSHRRVVSYKLNNIRLVVRFELDCAEPSSSSPEIDNLVANLSGIRLDKSSSSKQAKSFANSSSRLRYVESGCLDKSARQVELTTKSMFRGAKEYPESKINQMLLSRTDSLLIGWHQRGDLKQIEKLSWKSLCEKCGRPDDEKEKNDLLAKLKALLDELVKIVSKEPDTTFSAISVQDATGNYVLNVYKVKKEEKNLPSDLIDYLKSDNKE